MVVFIAFCGGSLGTGDETNGPSGATSGSDRAHGDGRHRRRGGKRWLAKRWPGYGRDHHFGIVQQAPGRQVEGSDVQDCGHARRV